MQKNPRPFRMAKNCRFQKYYRKLLKNENGEASYISVFFYILAAVVLIAFIINVFQIISAKQQMDHAADQLVKQIQLNGGVDSETDSLFDFLSGEISGARDLSYSVECSDSEDRIQIGSPFYVTVTGRCSLGGFWKFRLVNITVRSIGAGVSEHYWK
ncbi:MAG: DUF4320 family protein [Hungatella hathewayi]|nr:DUF4320 family protein [Hungatella hathewayi]